MVQHEIDNDSGHRDIKPDRHSEASKSAMSIKSRPQRRDDCDDDKGKDRKREQKVREQNHVINRAHPALRSEFYGTLSDGAEQAKMIGQITA